jgi:hypothetical protein
LEEGAQVLTISYNCGIILKYLEDGKAGDGFKVSRMALREGDRLLEKLKDYII